MTALCLTALAISIPTAVVAGTRNASASSMHSASWGRPQLSSSSLPHSEPARRIAGSHLAHANSNAAYFSANWSGLVDTGSQFTGVSAQWVVPQVPPSSMSEYSSTWTGIDGWTTNSLIQTGTGQDSSSSGTSYFAWYEILPAPEVILGVVAPGDQIQASVVEDVPGTWTITIDDATSNQGFSSAFSYDGPGTSAEWIEETPTNSSGNILPLADFGTVEMSNLTIGGTGLSSASSNSVSMVNTTGNVIAYPQNIDATNHSLQITFGSPPNNPPPTTTTTTTTTAPTTTTTTAPTTTTTTPPTTTTTTTPAPAPVSCTPASEHPTEQPTAMAAMRAANGCPGYWIVNAGGNVYAFGNAPYLGGINGSVPSPVIDVIATPDGKGYWLITANGTVRAFGDARSFGDMSGHQLNGQIIAMATTPDGGGYWLVGSDGDIFSFGDAPFYGSTGAMRLNRPVVGVASTPDGKGYWLVASDGGIFSFGDAPFLGSMGAAPLNKPVVGMTADPAGRGYRMVAADGGIFSFGAPFYGSLGANPPSAPIIGMAPSTDGNGYYMLSSPGSVDSFGDAPYLGGAS